MDCPSCIGQLEFTTIEDRGVYKCPLCGTERSAAVLKDAERWWGPVHLPLIDVVRNPPTAFRQLNDHPVTGAALVFYALSIFVQWHTATGQAAVEALKRLLLSRPFFQTPGVLFSLVLGIQLLITFLFSILLYGAASLNSDDYANSRPVTFKSLLTIHVFLSAIFVMLSIVPLHFRGGQWLVVLSSVTWLVWALGTIYRFSVLKSIGTYLMAMALPVILGMIAGLVFFYMMVRSPSFAHNAHSNSVIESVHEPAVYAWQVQRLDGSLMDMNTLRGKVVFLNFWATWCYPCRMEMPSIQKLYDRFKNNPGVVFVCVSEEPLGTIQAFVKKSGFTFPVYAGQSSLPAVFQSMGIPATYILSRDGMVVGRHIGTQRWDAEEIVRYLNKLADAQKTRVKS